MSGKVNFILGVNDHIPNGAAQEEFEALYNRRIRPMISALYQFPRINMVFHYSGVLLCWIERNHPELFVLFEDLLSRRQVELLGGGFYKPMMPLLPQTDRIAQIEMLTTYLRRRFGRRPQGCWLPSHAWEQNLVSPLGACGMGYTFLDESYFKAAGARPLHENWYDPCITEDQGKTILVFPVFSSLSETQCGPLLEKFLKPEGMDISFEGPITVFPAFHLPEENPSNGTETSLGERAETEYKRFFEELSRADNRVEFITPGRIFKNFQGLKKLYFSGHPESFKNNALPAPRQFLIDYPEAGLIYAKMIHTRVLINQLRGDKARKRSALEELWKAQDSALFSPLGLGNAPVRKAAYRALLEAESITRDKGSFSPSLSAFDYDLDGEDEYVFKDEKLNCYIKTQGAFLFELDYFPKAYNYLDFFVPFETQERKSRRCGFVDYLVPGEIFPKTSWQGIPGARFCGGERFQALEFDRIRRQVSFRLPPKEGVPLGNIEIKKTWYLKRNILSLKYELKNTGSQVERFFLAPMVDLSFSGWDEAFVKLHALRGNSKERIGPPEQKELFLQELGGLEFQDIRNESSVSLESSRQFDVRLFSVERENHQGSAEYQFTCVMPFLPITLEAGNTWEIGFNLGISSGNF